MSSTAEVLVISALALHKATLTLTGFAEPLDTSNWSKVYVLWHRMERSLERIEDGVVKERIKDFMELHLFVSIFNVGTNKISFTQITVMAFIHEFFEYEFDTDE